MIVRATMTSIKTRINECHCKGPSMDLLHLCFYSVCHDHADPVSVCYHSLIFWKNTGRERDLQNLLGMGRALVSPDIYFSKTLFRSAS